MTCAGWLHSPTLRPRRAAPTDNERLLNDAGQVNPTQCEVMTMVAVQVHGNNAAIVFAGSQETLS